MQDAAGGLPTWLQILFWTVLIILAMVAIWTLLRAPGRKQDPGRDENR